jgi:hypothetical protein
MAVTQLAKTGPSLSSIVHGQPSVASYRRQIGKSTLLQWRNVPRVAVIIRTDRVPRQQPNPRTAIATREQWHGLQRSTPSRTGALRASS